MINLTSADKPVPTAVRVKMTYYLLESIASTQPFAWVERAKSLSLLNHLLQCWGGYEEMGIDFKTIHNIFRSGP